LWLFPPSPVFAAYGWPAGLSDDEIPSRLLALNLERSKQYKTRAKVLTFGFLA
jgi:hypothetical protein